MAGIHCFGLFFVLSIYFWQLKAQGKGNTIDFGKLEMNTKLLEGFAITFNYFLNRFTLNSFFRHRVN